MTTPAPTINDITDLLRILRDNPEWLDQVRNVVLTQEILELPAALAALTQEVRDFIAEQRAINQEQKRTNDAIFARLDRIEADVAEAKTDIKELKSDMAEAKTDIKDLKTTVNRMDGTVGQLLGDQRERQVQANIHGFLRRHDRSIQNVIVLKGASQSCDQNLIKQTAQAVAAGLITEDEEDDLNVVDMVVCAQLNNSDQVVYYAIEISSVVDENDVKRSATRAEILSRVINTQAIPATIGGVTIPAAAALAAAQNVFTITTPQLKPAQNQTIPNEKA